MTPKVWEAAFIRRLAANPISQGDPDDLATRRWRARLRAKGFVVGATGPFGEKLANATKVAQHAVGVRADGVVGPVTWKKVGKLQKERRPIVRKPGWKPTVIDCRDGKHGYPVHPTRRWVKRAAHEIKYVLGHYTGNAVPFINDANFHVHSDYLDQGGAPRIAYTLGVEKNGDVRVFNNWDDITWHCDGGFNTVTLGVVFLGGEEGPNQFQRKALNWLYDQLQTGQFEVGGRKWPKMPMASTTHKHVNSTSCPGVKGESFYQTVGNFIAHPSK